VSPATLIKVARPGFWPTHLWFFLLPLGQREMFGRPGFWLGCAYVCFPLGLLLYGWNDLFDAETAVFLAGDEEGLLLRGEAEAPAFAKEAKEAAVAQWVHQHSQPAGQGTSTLSGAAALYLPLTGSRGPVGVLAIHFAPGAGDPGTDRMHLLEAFASQTALALERALLAREAHRQRLAVEGEKLRNAILAAVSHDLRTPLASIAGAASSLEASGERLDPQARRELVLTIHEEADRMVRLANNLLEMGRLQSGTVALRRDWQPIEEVFGSALHALEGPIGSRRVDVRVPKDLPLVSFDEVLIERVLFNLLENALRYAPAGSPIEIGASPRDGEILVEILDRGPGIAPGEEERIFEKFFRGEAARAGHGAGLGLAVARAIVEAHGGRIRAENRPGGGAAFRFTLPSVAEPPAVADETDQGAPGAAGEDAS